MQVDHNLRLLRQGKRGRAGATGSGCDLGIRHHRFVTQGPGVLGDRFVIGRDDQARVSGDGGRARANRGHPLQQAAACYGSERLARQAA